MITADLAPIEVGLNATLTVQELSGATAVRQVLAAEKEARATPVTEMPETVRSALPVFLTVIACRVEVVLIRAEPKASEVGDTAASGASPVPLTATVLDDDPSLLLLWAMLISADFAPVVAGANDTLMVQVLPTATVPQVVAEKEAASTPVTETPETRRSTLPVLLTVMVCGLDTDPAFTEPKASGACDTAASGPSPFPVKAMLEDDPAALWKMLTVADFAPNAVGLNAILTMQELLGATVPQLLVSRKETAPVPVIVMPETTRLAAPLLLTVMACAVEVLLTSIGPKSSGAGDTAASGASPVSVPVPIKAILDDNPAALWAMLTVADFAPMVVGLNATLTVQERPGATDPHAVVAEKAGSVTETPETTRLAVPVLLTVMDCVAEVVLTSLGAKAREACDSSATGPSPVPLRATLEEDGAAL